MTPPLTINADVINEWADDPHGPVALHLKQKLQSVEGEGAVIFPPTYADIGYNIDTLSDGCKVVTIDSVGSQANRMEPIFEVEPHSSLVPQIKIELHLKSESGEILTETRSILQLAHRGADAVVHACPKLAPKIAAAFRALKWKGNAGPLCQLVPTSLLFGVWDSRGGSGEKLPRLVRSMIRAWDVEELHAAAQFNSIWKALDSEQKGELSKEAKSRKVKLSEKGFADAPATFRKMNGANAAKMPEFVNGAPTPARRIPGGVLPKGPILRDTTLNLVALRRVTGATQEDTTKIRRYLLGLSLLAVTSDQDLYLREGCHLRYDDEENWQSIPRRGTPVEVDLHSTNAQRLVYDYTRLASEHFKERWPPESELIYRFDLNEAKKLLVKKDEDEEGGA